MADNLFEQEQAARETARRVAEERRATEAREGVQGHLDASRGEDERVVYDHFDEVHRLATVANQTKIVRDDATGRHLAAIEAHPDVDTADPMQTITQILMVLFGVVAAFCLDYFWLAGPVAYALKFAQISADSAFGHIARLVVPIVVITLARIIHQLKK